VLSRLTGGSNMQQACWEKVRPLRAVRPQTAAFTPMHDAPSLSGASLCALNAGHLAVYGGRCSSSGETQGDVYLVQIGDMPRGLAKWDRLRFDEGEKPPPRCYHAAVSFGTHAFDATAMLTFGGAGASNNLLHNDLWCLDMDLKGQKMNSCTRARWTSMPQDSSRPPPSARSSFVLTVWAEAAAAVLHGGLGNDGVVSDVWILEPTGLWLPMETSGGCVSRAHHVGVVHRNQYLVHSGQDATFLTVHSVHSLDLLTGTWQEVVHPGRPVSRIDAAAAAVPGVGMLIFGGVNTAFDFEPADLWLLTDAGADRSGMSSSLLTKGLGPSPHACGCLAVHGLDIFTFGGFDGKVDLDELWRLDFSKCIVDA